MFYFSKYVGLGFPPSAMRSRTIVETAPALSRKDSLNGSNKSIFEKLRVDMDNSTEMRPDFKGGDTYSIALMK